MTKQEFTLKLKETFEELLFNRVDLINSDEAEETDEQMLVALFQIFDTVLKNQDVLDSLYNSNATYEDVKEYMAMQYKSTN